jgi:Fe-S-cluster containining protein
MADNPWYANGLRFECTQCGNCCRNHGDYAFVSLSDADVGAIAAYLGLERADFLARYCEKQPGFHPTLRTDSPACVFLRADRRCAIYPVRPKQCATWPFWTENLEQATWEGPVKACCPGLDRGELHPREEIDRLARETDAWYEA